jgi:hypothetical protein
MWVFATLVEERIRQAQARGAFDDLPGAGRPLALDDDPLVPEELRVAWRLLRGAGLVGPGTDYDGPMPTTFAAMMALADRSGTKRDPYDRERRLAKALAREALDRRVRAGVRSGADPASVTRRVGWVRARGAIR